MADPIWSKDFINLPPIHHGKDKPIEFRVPQLEFIRAWFVLPHEDNPFSMGTGLGTKEAWDDPKRKLILTKNTESYCVDDNGTWKPVFVVTLDNAGGTARIELFDPKYVGQAQLFYMKVTQ